MDRVILYPEWTKALDKKLATKMNLPEHDDIIAEIEATDPEAKELERQEKFSEVLGNGVDSKNKKPFGNDKKKPSISNKKKPVNEKRRTDKGSKSPKS